MKDVEKYKSNNKKLNEQLNKNNRRPNDSLLDKLQIENANDKNTMNYMFG